MSRGRPRQDPAARFWRHVAKHPSGCWLWTGAIAAGTGYGVFNAGDRILGAHCFAWEIAHAGVPRNGFVVRHTCDTPACVNPRHLVIGTQKANVADMDARARRRPNAARGSDHYAAKLTEDQVIQIRRLGIIKTSVKDIARRFGVSEGTISAILTGRTWRHAKVPGR